MSTYPSLAEVIAKHQPDMDKPCWANERWCQGCQTSLRVWPWSEYPKHQADAWREACAITTVEQLDALPVGSAVHLAGGIAELVDTGEGDPPEWWVDGKDQGSLGSELPALLIWSPDWPQP